MKDLSIIIVSYNTKEFLKKCLVSIEMYIPQTISYEAIIVDNVSRDGTIQEVQSSKFKVQNLKLKIIQNKENLGFSKANNLGVKESDGKYILFLNPDTVFQERGIEKLLMFLEEHKHVGAVTCKVVLESGKLDDACHRGFPTPWNAFCHFSGLSKLFPKSKLFSGYSLGWMDLETIHEIDACAGAFMLVRRIAGEQVGWWDEDYFWYGDDLDFCYRLKEKGWKIYFVPDVSILHYKGVSGGIKSHSKHLTTADRDTRIRATVARFEAMKLFYIKHYINKYPRFINWIVLQVINSKLLLALESL